MIAYVDMIGIFARRMPPRRYNRRVISPRLILASRSPRRAMLLREAGYEFTQAEPAFADPPHPDTEELGCDPVQHAMDLAVRKAESLRDILADHDADPGRPVIIISADTICVGAKGELIGQPLDVDDARRIIQSFFNCAHDVVTGVALLRVRFAAGKPARTTADDLITYADAVAVSFGRIGDAELEAYLATGQWRGKAGGYNLYNQQAAGWDVRIPAGADATTVVGLPMRKLAAALARWGIEGGQKGRM